MVAGLAVDRTKEPIGAREIGIEQERRLQLGNGVGIALLLRVVLALLEQPLRLGGCRGLLEQGLDEWSGGLFQSLALRLGAFPTDLVGLWPRRITTVFRGSLFIETSQGEDLGQPEERGRILRAERREATQKRH